MTNRALRSPVRFAAVAALALGAAEAARASPPDPISLEEARIFFEYNQTADDLGVHVSLDGEDWRQLSIQSPSGQVIFAVKGNGGYKELGMTELFFEGAEPSLSEFPLEELLGLFPEGEYTFSGLTAGEEKIGGVATLTHAVPDGPDVTAQVGANDFVRISWTPVSGPAPGFPVRPIVIAGYQVLVAEKLDVKLPASATSLTLPPELVASLGSGEQQFEVLAIEEGGNQTITESAFVIP